MKKSIRLSSAHIVLAGFLLTVLLGSILLSMPFCSASGKPVPYIDALFTATTAVCVTGLVTLPVVSTWSTAGHVIILILIQIGGLGIITVVSGIMLLMKHSFRMRDSIIIRDAFNLNSLSGIKRFLKATITGVFAVEAIGAVLYMTVFVPEFGAYGIWVSVFNSVSAFCNAGIDIISDTSLCRYVTNPAVNAITSMLIIISGIGFVVWFDVLRVIREKKRRFRFLTLHSKLALSSTAILLGTGTLLFMIFEYNNGATIGSFSFFEKLGACFFQSVTTRTAGFATVPQENLTNGSAFVSLILMFIGGSPVGTAGGIKTVTFAVLVLTALSAVRNKNNTEVFSRSIPDSAVHKAIAVAAMSITVVVVSTLLMCYVSDRAILDILYETVSATATVGLTRGFTPELDTAGKLIIIFAMYFGRVGPISLALAFVAEGKSKNIVTCPEEDVNIG